MRCRISYAVLLSGILTGCHTSGESQKSFSFLNNAFESVYIGYCPPAGVHLAGSSLEERDVTELSDLFSIRTEICPCYYCTLRPGSCPVLVGEDSRGVYSAFLQRVISYSKYRKYPRKTFGVLRSNLLARVTLSLNDSLAGRIDGATARLVNFPAFSLWNAVSMKDRQSAPVAFSDDAGRFTASLVAPDMQSSFWLEVLLRRSDGWSQYVYVPGGYLFTCMGDSH